MRSGKSLLRKIRIGLAIASFTLLTLLFFDFTEVSHQWFGWLADVQFIPALLALNVGVVITLIFLTLILGRVYCSVICPLGLFQDAISRIAGSRKKNRFAYSRALPWLRYGFLALFAIAFIAGIGSLAALLDPYAFYGRIASNLFAPFYRWGNNLLAFLAENAGSYTFYHVDVWAVRNLATFVIAVLTFALVAILAWRNGRTYCNTVCPVGTVLSLLSRVSVFKPVIDTEKCNNCGLCARNCKASCIDSKNHAIDYSRCVTCLNCIDNCTKGAIDYRPFFNRETADVKPMPAAQAASASDTSRRAFLTTSSLALVSGVLKALEAVADGGLAVIKEKKRPKREIIITPPGSKSARDFARHCTACGLCVSACPNQVLRPSGDLSTLMQPRMSFERGYCRPECIACSEVCPTDAISLITKAEKSATKIGTAVWVRDKCVVLADNVVCGNCARHCPTKAIEMVPSDPGKPDSKKIPTINAERCIGCGSCENLCPARPFSAIYVEGIENHRTV